MMKFSDFEYNESFQFRGKTLRKNWNAENSVVQFEVLVNDRWLPTGVSYTLEMVDDFKAMFIDYVNRMDVMIEYELEVKLNG